MKRSRPTSYALARSLGCGTRVCSDPFDAGGRPFRLEVYPSGVVADAATHLGVFLTTPCATAGGGGSMSGAGQQGRPASSGHLLFEIAILDKVDSGRVLGVGGPSGLEGARRAESGARE